MDKKFVDIYTMELHETKQISKTDFITVEVMRVPGGWLYSKAFYVESQNNWVEGAYVFVPFDNDFMVKRGDR